MKNIKIEKYSACEKSMKTPLGISVLPVQGPEGAVVYFWSAKQASPWLEPAGQAAEPKQWGGPFAKHIEAYSAGLDAFPNRVVHTLPPVHHSTEPGALWVAFAQSLMLTVETPVNQLTRAAAQAKPRPSVRRAAEPVPEELEIRRNLAFVLTKPVSRDWACTLDLDALEFVYGRERDNAVTFVYRAKLYFVGYEGLDWPSLWGTVKPGVTGVGELEGAFLRKAVELPW